MTDSMTLLAILAAALAGALLTAAAIALGHRAEVARIASSRMALAREWRRLAEVWDAIDPAFRPVARLTPQQQAALYVALVKAARQPATQPEGSTR